jgi:uncharacterized membrane protein YeaQ/YmgE (transglycosylase-associated protein family)
LITAIIVGGFAGFLAGKIMRGEGYGILANIILGLLGGVIGGFILPFAGLHTTGMIGDIVAGTIGAVILVAVFGKKR